MTERPWGFALIELPVTGAAMTPDRERVAEEDKALARLQGMIRDRLEKREPAPAIEQPDGRKIAWPSGVAIAAVRPITRYYGRRAYPVYHLYVELNGDAQRFGQAFEFLEHFCGVEGYGGGF